MCLKRLPERKFGAFIALELELDWYTFLKYLFFGIKSDKIITFFFFFQTWFYYIGSVFLGRKIGTLAGLELELDLLWFFPGFASRICFFGVKIR